MPTTYPDSRFRGMGTLNGNANSASPPKRILCVGEDQCLLQVRQMLLERDGYMVEILCAERLTAFKPILPFALVILCHSIEEAIQDQLIAWSRQNLPQAEILLLEGAHESMAGLYLPRSSTRPRELLQTIRELLVGRV